MSYHERKSDPNVCRIARTERELIGEPPGAHVGHDDAGAVIIQAHDGAMFLIRHQDVDRLIGALRKHKTRAARCAAVSLGRKL